MNVQSVQSASGSSFSPNTPSDELINTLSLLLDELSVPHERTLDSIADAAQRWRRKPHQERWEVSDLNIDQKTRKTVLALLEKIGLINELKPDSNHFDYALAMGATVPRMESRLKQLVKQWQEGVRFDQIVFLVSQRPIVAGADKIDAFVARLIGKESSVKARMDARPLTETEGARMVFEVTPMPDEMRELPIVFIDTPRRWQQDHWQRANTRDTLKQWMQDYVPLKGKSMGGKALVVSDQPHALYQHEVVRQELPEQFETEVTGERAMDQTRLIIVLDAMALWLHNLQKRMTDQSS